MQLMHVDCSTALGEWYRMLQYQHHVDFQTKYERKKDKKVTV